MTVADDPIATLNAIITVYTRGYRKNAATFTRKSVGNLEVFEITGYPEAPSHGALVDVHFIKVGFTEAAADKDTFFTALHRALTSGAGEYTVIDETRFYEGPSYIEVGAWLGSQDNALRLFALIEHYEMGSVVTPATLHVFDAEADALAGQGYVMGILNRSYAVREAVK